MTIEEKLKRLPDKSGVYIMKDKNGNIIYVGKAKILKNRVRQYFRNSAKHPPKVKSMVDNVHSFEYIITSSEREAFVLECNLIKEYRPRYNILLKDDKTYPFIRLSKEDYPRLSFERRTDEKKGEYFGPYTSAFFCREVIELANKIFALPKCNRKFPQDFGKKRPCLYYSMGRCMGICKGDVPKEEYARVIEDVVEFIKGKRKALMEKLTKEMMEASKNLQFEHAASLRDKIESIKYIEEKQNVTILKNAKADIFAFYAKDNDVSFEALFVRDGKMTGRENFSFDGASGIDDAMLMENFLTQYYEKEDVFVPPLIIVSVMPSQAEMIEEHLKEKCKRNVEIRLSERGKYKELLDMAKKNAEKTLLDIREQKMQYQLKKSAAIELGKLLGLTETPLRIESYDISHTAGDETVGAMVVFENGKYAKKENRYFKLKDIENNDAAALRQVLVRRFENYFEEASKIGAGEMDEDKAKFALLPDLILMDGGEVQLGVALSVLSEFDLPIPTFGMVKDDKHRTRALISTDGEIYVNPTSSAFRLLTAIQDEVHRLAISYHRKRKEKKMTKSPLLSLSGVGEATYKKLMRNYKSVQSVKSASKDELIKVVGKKAGESIYAFYHEKN